MTLCVIHAPYYGPELSGGNARYYGIEGWIQDGNLVGNVPEELLEPSIQAGRVTPLADFVPVDRKPTPHPTVNQDLQREIERARQAAL